MIVAETINAKSGECCPTATCALRLSSSNPDTNPGILCVFSATVLELSMPSNLPHNMMSVHDLKLGGLATICLFCLSVVLPSASAQSKTTRYQSRSSTHYKSPSRVHSVDQKPHSVPSSVAPEVLAKPSGGAVMSRYKELDQLERANVV